MFDLQNVTAGYGGKDVLHGVSIHIKKGERVSFIGKSGAGKTTLLQLMYDKNRSNTAIIPQDWGLVKSLSVFHNIYMGKLNEKPTWYNIANLIHPMAGEVEPVREIACKLGLEEKLFTPVGSLSGGQKLRTAIGRAFYRSGSVLLADEPVSAVDDHQSREVLQYVNDTFETVVLSMHDVDLALEYSDRIIGLKDGQVVVDTPTRGIKKSDLDKLYLN